MLCFRGLVLGLIFTGQLYSANFAEAITTSYDLCRLNEALQASVKRTSEAVTSETLSILGHAILEKVRSASEFKDIHREVTNLEREIGEFQDGYDDLVKTEVFAKWLSFDNAMPQGNGVYVFPFQPKFCPELLDFLEVDFNANSVERCLVEMKTGDVHLKASVGTSSYKVALYKKTEELFELVGSENSLELHTSVSGLTETVFLVDSIQSSRLPKKEMFGYGKASLKIGFTPDSTNLDFVLNMDDIVLYEERGRGHLSFKTRANPVLEFRTQGSNIPVLNFDMKSLDFDSGDGDVLKLGALSFEAALLDSTLEVMNIELPVDGVTLGNKNNYLKFMGKVGGEGSSNIVAFIVAEHGLTMASMDLNLDVQGWNFATGSFTSVGETFGISLKEGFYQVIFDHPSENDPVERTFEKLFPDLEVHQSRLSLQFSDLLSNVGKCYGVQTYVFGPVDGQIDINYGLVENGQSIDLGDVSILSGNFLTARI